MNISYSGRPKSELPSLDALDRRLNAFRPDLADLRLRNKISAEKFVAAKAARIVLPVVDLKGSPDPNANTAHQLLLGEDVLVFEDRGEMIWVQSMADGYVGYVASASVVNLPASNDQAPPTHVVNVPLTFCYPEPELRSPPLSSLSIASRVNVVGQEMVRGTQYHLLESGGAIIAKHLRPVEEHDSDYVKICELLLHTPYLWGGSSGFGIDCSSFIQLSMRMCGRRELRDSDMQAATLGTPIDPGENLEKLQRGDLIFWHGHVAVHKGTVHGVPHIIHSSGHTMTVAAEPLRGAIERIAYLYENPIGYRRP